MGIKVARQLCKKRNTTNTTRNMASAKLLATSAMDSSTKRVLSTTVVYFIPAGKSCAKRSRVALTSPTVCSALASLVSLMANPAAGWPFNSLEKVYSLLPSSTRAISFSRTKEPSPWARTMIFSNSLGSSKRPFTLVEY